jgi:hypothetical protein
MLRLGFLGVAQSDCFAAGLHEELSRYMNVDVTGPGMGKGLAIHRSICTPESPA